MTLRCIFTLLVLLAGICPGMILAASPDIVQSAGNDRFQLDLAAGVDYQDADSSYDIGGRIVTPLETVQASFPVSSLVFPMDAPMGRLRAELTMAQRWFVGATVRRNLDNSSGTNKDFDFDPAGRVDIFSFADTRLDAIDYDISLGYRLYHHKFISVRADIGYRYQDFDFEVHNVVQFYPGRPWLGVDTADGLAGTYQVTYEIPYVDVAVRMQPNPNWRIDLKVGGSPLVRVSDEDQHLLRGITAVGSLDGNALMLDMETRYQFASGWFLGFGLHYVGITADGTQANFIHGIWVWTTDENVTSDQFSASLMAGYRF